MDLKPTDVIGRDLVIKGEIHGDEDLIVEGRVQGNISLKKHLIIERTGVIDADIQMENITVKGEMNGNMKASDKVEIMADARVNGDIKSPRVVIEDGAKFRGVVDMEVHLPDNI
jgi:cytoskeletal protein CcmA (bactofilin family)